MTYTKDEIEEAERCAIRIPLERVKELQEQFGYDIEAFRRAMERMILDKPPTEPDK